MKYEKSADILRDYCRETGNTADFEDFLSYKDIYNHLKQDQYGTSGTELYFAINWPTSKRICQRSLKCLKPNYACNGMFSVE